MIPHRVDIEMKEGNFVGVVYNTTDDKEIYRTKQHTTQYAAIMDTDLYMQRFYLTDEIPD